MTMLLAVLVAIVPLIITPGTLFYFDVTPKLIALMAGAAAALLWVCQRGLARVCTARWFYVLIGAQIVSLGLSTLLSHHVQLSMWGSNWRTLGLISQVTLLVTALAVFTYVTGDTRRVMVVLRAVAAAGSLAALYGIAQYFGFDPWQPAKAYHVGEGIFQIVRPPGTLGHADYFAGYLLFVAFAGAAIAVCDRERWRAVGMGAASLASVAIVLSGTRGALVGLIIGGAFLVARLRPKTGWRGAAAIAAIALAAAGFYFSPAGTELRARVHWARDDAWGGARLLLWRDATRMGAEHWAVGWGPETFPAEFMRYQSVELAREYPDYYYESPHDWLLDAWTQQGVLGVAVLIGMAALGMRAGWRAGRLGTCLAAGLLAAMAAHLFTVWIVVTALYFFVWVALLAGMDSASEENRVRVPVAAVAAALPVAALLVLISGRMLWADRVLELAKRDLESGRRAEAVAHYTDARRFGLQADLWWARSGAPGAMDAARRAAAGEDRQNGWYTVAYFYARAGDTAHAEESLRATIACAPNWFKPHWMLAQMLQAQGKMAEARAEAERAATLNAGKNPEVTRTAMALRGENREE